MAHAMREKFVQPLHQSAFAYVGLIAQRVAAHMKGLATHVAISKFLVEEISYAFTK
jgi:hypothetical protein